MKFCFYWKKKGEKGRISGKHAKLRLTAFYRLDERKRGGEAVLAYSPPFFYDGKKKGREGRGIGIFEKKEQRVLHFASSGGERKKCRPLLRKKRNQRKKKSNLNLGVVKGGREQKK